MTEQIIQSLARIMGAINTNLPALSANANPAENQRLLNAQQAATANFQAAQARAFDAGDALVQQTAQQLQDAQTAVNASLNDLTNISNVLNALANAVAVGAQIVALGTSIV